MTTLQAWSRRPTAWICALFVLVACAQFVPQQGWNRSHGPVVPHDSFPADCTLCHTGGDWHTLREDFTFDHEGRTGVALTGAHAAAGCLLCHNDRGPVAQFASRGCAGCHVDPHQGRLGADCKVCHDEVSWRPNEQIALHDRTRFPLVGAHAATACFRCHPGAQVGNFAGAYVQCEQCHQQDLSRARTPDHFVNGWTTDCQRCHTPIGFAPAQFEHPPSFPLVLGHAGRRCAECHGNGTFTGLSTACFSCHADDYSAVQNPVHATSAFPTDCTVCHGLAAWRPATFAHAQSFPLTGAHQLACNRCHTTPGTYAGLSTQCSSCHLQDYQRTTNPSHTAGGFPLDCQSCHSTFAWRPANFTHPASFPLTNAHAVTCVRCHTMPGVYTGNSTACNSCHAAQYAAAANPTHAGIGMPRTCEQCHTTVSWRPSSFVHRFPLRSEHNRTCTECHRDPTNVANFSCTHCHDHSQAEMADEHRGVNGYVWVSSACYNCHPNGRH